MTLRFVFLFLCTLLIYPLYAQKPIPSMPDERRTLNEDKEDEEREEKHSRPLANAAELMQILQQAKNKKGLRTQGGPALQSFVEKGPTNYPGRINTVMIDNINGIYLAGTASGGLWKFIPDRTVLGQSQTNNTSWQKVNDFELSLSVVKIVQSPVNPQIIYYATSAGETLSGAGIFKSTDGGATFYQLAATNPKNNVDFQRIYSMEIHPVTHDIYVGMIGQVYVSKDAGASFQKVYNDIYSARVESIFFNNNGAVMLAIDNRGVFRSPDGSANSFVLLTSGITNGTGQNNVYFYIKIAGCETQRNVVYALISGPSSSNYLDGIYKSTNGGDTWIKVNDPRSTVGYYQPYHSFVLSVKPSDPNTLITAGVSASSSSDGGQTWKYIMNIGIDHAAIVWEKTSAAVYFVCDQGMYFHISDATMDQYGNRADMTSNGLNNLQCYYGDYFLQGNGVVYGAQDNQSCVMRNNSGLAYHYTGGDGFNVFTHKQDTNVVYGSLQYGSLYRCDSITPKSWPYLYPTNTVSILDNTLDANQDGSPDEGHQFYTQFIASQSNSNNLFFPTNARMYRSKNRGTNWTAISPQLSLSNCVMAYDEQITAPNLYYAVDNHLYRIKDALNIGVVAQEELSINLGFIDYAGKLEMDANDYTKLYYMLESFGSTTGPYIYRVDGINGSTPVKVDITGDMPIYVNDIAVYPGNSNLLFAATDIGLFYTVNGGTNWTLVVEFPYVKVRDIKFHPITKKLYIFTYGRGAWIADLAPQIITTNVIVDNTNPSSKDVLVYPSPAEDYIKIKTHTTSGEAELFLLDINGRIVKHLEHYANESAFFIQNLPSGIYIVKTKSDQGWNYAPFVKK